MKKLSLTNRLGVLAAAMAGLAAVAYGGSGIAPANGIKCPKNTPCKDLVCGGTKGCTCENESGIDICLQN